MTAATTPVLAMEVKGQLRGWESSSLAANQQMVQNQKHQVNLRHPVYTLLPGDAQEEGPVLSCICSAVHSLHREHTRIPTFLRVVFATGAGGESSGRHFSKGRKTFQEGLQTLIGTRLAEAI
jgi:hypothetical protein